MYYRFNNGSFVKADTFDEAKLIAIQEIESEIENPERWLACTCLGFQHSYNCPEHPANKGEIPF